jgi:hypothetical protein
MGHDNDTVVKELYKRYYQSDSTPESVISSHWKFYHNKIKVEFNGNEIKSLSGFGFGDMQDKSFISRIFSWITIASYLYRCPNRKELLWLMRIAIPLVKKMGLLFSYDCFRQLCFLNLIMNRGETKKERLNIINIGDGYGFLSALIKELFPNSLICLVDLGKTLSFQAHYCKKAHPECSHRLVLDSSEAINQLDLGFLYCPAEYLEKLGELSFDLAINIASMQEMNQTSINTYFDFLRHHMPSDNLFYCCNREEKELPGGEISKFFSYPWWKEDIHIVDEYCPWHLYFFSFSRAKNGPQLFKIRIPFINYFDGPHRHRLTILQTNG